MTTPDPDFRALCAELLAAFEIQLEEMSLDNRLCKRARAALATPLPKRPTAIEIIDLSIEIDDAGLGIVEIARAVLERWGK